MTCNGRDTAVVHSGAPIPRSPPPAASPRTHHRRAKPPINMIYDVRGEYYQGFLSTKQGLQGAMDKKDKAVPAAAPAADGDAMETD